MDTCVLSPNIQLIFHPFGILQPPCMLFTLFPSSSEIHSYHHHHQRRRGDWFCSFSSSFKCAQNVTPGVRGALRDPLRGRLVLPLGKKNILFILYKFNNFSISRFKVTQPVSTYLAGFRFLPWCLCEARRHEAVLKAVHGDCPLSICAVLLQISP